MLKQTGGPGVSRDEGVPRGWRKDVSWGEDRATGVVHYLPTPLLGWGISLLPARTFRTTCVWTEVSGSALGAPETEAWSDRDPCACPALIGVAGPRLAVCLSMGWSSPVSSGPPSAPDVHLGLSSPLPPSMSRHASTQSSTLCGFHIPLACRSSRERRSPSLATVPRDMLTPTTLRIPALMSPSVCVRVQALLPRLR